MKTKKIKENLDCNTIRINSTNGDFDIFLGIVRLHYQIKKSSLDKIVSVL